MKNLIILIIEDATFSTGPEHLPNSLRVLDWSCYPSPSLPSDFNPKRFEIMLMHGSCLQMFKPQKMLESLSIINLEHCKFLTDLPSLREAPLLTTLRLDNCCNLVNIDESIGFLDKLQFLSAKHCTKLKTLAPCIMLISLETLDLGWCESLESFPEVLGKMEKIRTIYLDYTAINKLPFSIGNFVWLELLSLKGCYGLHQLPGSVSIMPKVQVVIGYGHEAYNFFEEEFSSEVSPMAILIGGSNRYLDVYYPYISSNNAIQVCSPNPLLPSDFNLLFAKVRPKDLHRSCRVSIMHFSFRNKFTKVGLCCSFSFPMMKGLMMITFNFRVFINDTMQFSAMCNYMFMMEWRPILWCDLEGKVEGMFPEQEWNKVEIVFELDFPFRRNSRNENTTMSFGRGSLGWSLIGVYEEGNNKEDIEFEDHVSIFPLSNIEPPSSLCYVVK